MEYDQENGGIRRNYELPVMISADRMAGSNLDKAELPVKTFKKVHSSDNLSEEAQCRSDILMDNPN